MGLRFGQHPSLAEGLHLCAWRGGPSKGRPKLPPAVRSLLVRSLVEVRAGRFGFRAYRIRLISSARRICRLCAP